MLRMSVSGCKNMFGVPCFLFLVPCSTSSTNVLKMGDPGCKSMFSGKRSTFNEATCKNKLTINDKR